MESIHPHTEFLILEHPKKTLGKKIAHDVFVQDDARILLSRNLLVGEKVSYCTFSVQFIATSSLRYANC